MSHLFIAFALILPLTLSSNVSLHTAQAADTTYDYTGYTVTGQTADTRFAEPDNGYYTIQVVRQAKSNWYFTFLMLRSDVLNGVTPAVVRVRAFYDDNGTARSQTRFNLTFNGTDYADTRTVQFSRDRSISTSVSINVVNATSGAWARYIVSAPSGVSALYASVYDGTNPTSADTSDDPAGNTSVQHQLLMLIAQPTNCYDIDTGERIAPEYVQYDIADDTYTTVPIDIPGYTLVESAMPSNQNGTLPSTNSVRNENIFYIKTRVDQGIFWLKFVKNSEGYVDVSGWLMRRGGTNPDIPEAQQSLPDNNPSSSYDFESNPDGLPVSEGPVTETDAPNYYVRLRFANLDSKGEPIDKPVMNMPTTFKNWAYGKLYSRPPVVPEDEAEAATSIGLAQTLTMRRPTDPSVIYYYRKNKSSL